MVLHGCKRRREPIIVGDGKGDTLVDKQRQGECTMLSDGRGDTLVRSRKPQALTSKSELPLLDLPYHILYDIFARLPLLNILRCRCVCKTLLGLLKDSYFSTVHLTRAPIVTTNLILQENVGKWGALHFFTFDLQESALASCSSDNQNGNCYFSHGLPTLSRTNADFSFRTQRLTLVGSCNGLLCLYFASSPNPFYGICNPLLGECLKLPPVTESAPAYTYANYSGFGYSTKMKQYKVISFMYRTSSDPQLSTVSKQMVANVHTLGSDSWRRIENVPCPERSSFDPFLNGALHWITNSGKPSELISSFDLENEMFKAIPPPPHFNVQYMKKVVGINIGILRDCMCMCYIYNGVEFEVWVMKEYGVQDSWTKEFSIDLKFYCKLQVDDLRRPIKFFSNGDLLFISSYDSIVCFSPQKRTFREMRSLGPWLKEVSAHSLSFLSLKEVAGSKKDKVRNLKVGRRRYVFGV
ncbi:F-box protein At3g07870-like isoform X2 [Andrographis paniculata]|uniref:F-box protein At3g07870-like isoform X2 n=1 Tax=Andrographis paniculata TaxID=175694 RepID=UPI0021E8221B|nr:F-box protein At3g07870-like isoform X2 [Andrographis paniculata]